MLILKTLKNNKQNEVLEMKPVRAYKNISRACSMCETKLTICKILKSCLFDEFIYDTKDIIDKLRMFYVCIDYEKYKCRMIEIGCAKYIIKHADVKARYNTLKKAEIRDLLNRFTTEANNLKIIFGRKSGRQ